MQLMRRTSTPPFLIPPRADAVLPHVSQYPRTHSPLLKNHKKENTAEGRRKKAGSTYLMELTPTNQPRHAIPGLKLLKTDDALRRLTPLINAILLRSYVWEQPARLHAEAVIAAAPGSKVRGGRCGGGVRHAARAGVG